MYDKFVWTAASLRRNDILQRYEPLQPFVLYEFARHIHATAFVDVGANIGAYTLFLSTLPSIESIWTFEASKATFEELETNLRLNKIADRVTPIQKAVSNAHGQIEFGLIDVFSGANSVTHTSLHSDFVERITVESDTLDNLVKVRDQACAVKIDVEGHETYVLSGGLDFFRMNRIVVQIENYDSNKDGSADNILESIKFKKLLRIGPDAYYTNCRNIDEKVVLDVIERAASEMIRYSLLPKTSHGDLPSAVLQLPGGIEVRLRGTLAKAGRWVKQILKR